MAHYGSRAGIETLAGVTNATAYADTENTNNSDTIAGRYEAALTYADGQIAQRLSAVYVVSAGGLAGDDATNLAEIANRLALKWLYDSRANRDETLDQWMGEQEKWARSQLQLYSAGVLPLAASKVSSNAPVFGSGHRHCL